MGQLSQNHIGKNHKQWSEWENCFYASKYAALQIPKSGVTDETGGAFPAAELCLLLFRKCKATKLKPLLRAKGLVLKRTFFQRERKRKT